MLKGHDVNGDNHVDVDDLKAAFTKAGVSSKCLQYAQDSMDHLTTHHDHDDNKALHHDELDKWKNKDEL